MGVGVTDVSFFSILCNVCSCYKYDGKLLLYLTTPNAEHLSYFCFLKLSISLIFLILFSYLSVQKRLYFNSANSHLLSET